jgi:lysophospholipase L1-like esterase
MALRVLAGIGLLVMLAVGALVFEPGSSSGAHAPPSQAYMSLGDSLAFGEGATNPGAGGFAAQVYQALQPGESGSATPGEFLNLGRAGGETSDDMVSGQLGEAVAEIATRRDTAKLADDVAVITISIGGNDFFDLVGICRDATVPIDPSSLCAQSLAQTFSAYQSNLTAILSQLRSAAGPDAKLAIMTYYNSLPACDMAELAPLAELALEGDGGSIPGLNNLIRSIASAHGVAVAEGYGLLESDDLVGGQDCLHPNEGGHAKLADAFIAALADQ